ncbi:MAG: hypothetical protein ABIH92_01725 [Nanoarchaeota archaeon]
MQTLRLGRPAIGREVVEAMRAAAAETGGRVHASHGMRYCVSWNISGQVGFDREDEILEFNVTGRFGRRLEDGRNYRSLGVSGMVGDRAMRYVDLEKNPGASSRYESFSRELNAALANQS